jgi:hypothetical protein
VNTLSSAEQKAGDTFALRLAAPLVVDGMVVLPAGTRGEGEVIESDGPGIGGKAAKMVLAAKYLDVRHGRVPLDALQLSRRAVTSPGPRSWSGSRAWPSRRCGSWPSSCRAARSSCIRAS